MLNYSLYQILVLTIVTIRVSEASDKCNSSSTVIGPEIFEGKIKSPKDKNNRQCNNRAAHEFRIEPGSPGTAIRLHLEHLDLKGKDSRLQISLILNGTTAMIENLSQDHGTMNDIVAPELYGMEIISHSGNFAATFSRFNVEGENCTCPNGLYNLNDLVFNISSPNYPNPSYCPNTNCYYVVQTQQNHAVQLTLIDADLSDEDMVTIQEHITMPREQIAVWTGKFDSIDSKRVTSKSRGLIITFSRVSNTQGRGFLAQIQRVNNNEGYVIQYEFHDFYIQDCTDKLSVFDTSHDDKWELIHFCDQIRPDEFLTTSTRQSAIKFVTGFKNINARFNITYKALEYDQNCACAGEQPMVISSSTIDISFAHQLHCQFIDCIYELTAPSAAAQEIIINLRVKAPHQHGAFYIYEGLPSGDMRLHDSFGRTVRHTAKLYSNVTIHYHSAWKGPVYLFQTLQEYGFRALITWPECECGKSELYAQTNYQYLLSPNHPLSYCHGVVCVWKITAPEGKEVLVKINEIKLETGVDYLRIYCGTTVRDRIPLQILTGNHTTKRIYSCRTALTLHLSSGDGSDRISRRFNIKYKVLSENDSIGRSMVAENFETLIDNKMDPCDDFYEYACGKFQGLYNGKHLYDKLHPILANDLMNSIEQLTVNSSSLNVLQQLKQAYIICKTDDTPDDQITVEAISWLNKTTGGFPLG